MSLTTRRKPFCKLNLGLGLVGPLPPSMHRSPTLRSSTLLGTVQYLHAGTANNTPAREWMRIGDSLLYQIFSGKIQIGMILLCL